MDISGKKLLILGGTRISCEIVKRAKEFGLYTIVTDYNNVDKSPAKLLADKYFDISVADVDAVVDLIKQEKIDGVMVGYADVLMPYYADICTKADLPCYGTKEQFETLTNKDSFKTLCRKYNVPVVPEYTLELDDFDRSVKSIHFPVLVKPSDNSGARGITICHNPEELKNAYEYAMSFSSNKKVLIEKYINGREVTALWVFQDGELHITCIANRHVKRISEDVVPLPVGYTMPASITDSFLANIAPQAKKMLKSIGVKNGFLFMQCLVEGDDCYISDIGYRYTGVMEYKVLEDCCGYNPYKMQIYFAITGRMADENIASKVNPYLGKYGFNLSFLAEAGTIARIEGIEESMKIRGVLDHLITHVPGDEITQDMVGLLSQLSVRVVGVADSYEKLCETIESINNEIKIISTDNQDMIQRRLCSSDFKEYIRELE